MASTTAMEKDHQARETPKLLTDTCREQEIHSTSGAALPSGQAHAPRRGHRWIAGALVTVLGACSMTVAGQSFTESRSRMVQDQIAARGVDDEGVLEAMRAVPRHEFVPESNRSHAYEDRPLPIGYGQTISQPYIVGYMTEVIGADSTDRILEIGTGSGYQAAILSEIGADVFTMEIIPELAEEAAGRLERLGYERVAVRQGDGYHGWPEEAPFDAIVVTAAAGHIPPPLIAQLKNGGAMVIPVGTPFFTQSLTLVGKQGSDVITRSLMPVRFVPFTRAPE